MGHYCCEQRRCVTWAFWKIVIAGYKFWPGCALLWFRISRETSRDSKLKCGHYRLKVYRWRPLLLLLSLELWDDLVLSSNIRWKLSRLGAATFVFKDARNGDRRTEWRFVEAFNPIWGSVRVSFDYEFEAYDRRVVSRGRTCHYGNCCWDWIKKNI